MHDDGTVTVRRYVSMPTDQRWFWTTDWQEGEHEADESIKTGNTTVHRSVEDMFAHLDVLPNAPARSNT